MSRAGHPVITELLWYDLTNIPVRRGDDATEAVSERRRAACFVFGLCVVYNIL